MRRVRAAHALLLLSLPIGLARCGSDPAAVPAADAAPPSEAGDPLCERNETLDRQIPAEWSAYAWTCAGEVEATGAPVAATPPPDDCTSGVWPDLDDTKDVCPTISDAVRTDETSGKTLPTKDDRSLPLELPPIESGSFLPPSAPEAWPTTLRVVAWNMEYTAHLDEQIALLKTHPELSKGDVFLLNEVDRCSARNGTRRAAKLLAQALEGQWIYGVEFVELSIDRTLGGDTGQAIVSRRPLSAASQTCHSKQFDWFASKKEPRLGQRIVLHADVPVGPKLARVYAAHLESNDVFGEKRSVQSKEILDVAQRLACDRPQIVAGDLNAPYCGGPDLEVFRKAGFVDAVGLAGDLEPTRSGLRLDYAWTRGFRVLRGGVVRGLPLSDHDPIWVDLELAP